MWSSLARRLCGRNVHVFNVAYAYEIVSELIRGEQHQAILAGSEQLEDVDMKTEEREFFQTELFCKTMLSAAVDSGPISLPWMRLHFRYHW